MKLEANKSLDAIHPVMAISLWLLQIFFILTDSNCDTYLAVGLK